MAYIIFDEERQRNAAPELYASATAAWYVIQALLAVREAPTDELLIEVRDALRAAIDKADGPKLLEVVRPKP